MTNAFTVPRREHAASRSYLALPNFSPTKWHGEFWAAFLLTDARLA